MPKETKKPQKTLNNKEESEKVKHFSMDLPASLHSKLKIAAVKADKTMGDFIRDILVEKLK
jgi:hypothetical protein